MARRIFGKSNKGSGMILGFMAMFVMVTLGVAYLSLTATSVLSSKSDVLRARALAAAEAGADRAASFLRDGGPNGEAVGAWRTSHPSGQSNIHTNDTFYIESLSNNDYFKLCCASGSGITAGKIVVTSIGYASEGGKTAKRSLQVVYEVRAENVNCWSNAIFGGVGQAGKSINGNVKIRGSVHLLGDGESYTDLDHDGHWDAREPFTDSNKNGKWDPGEPYTDLDGDGKWSDAEPFQDVNGNSVYDPALTVTDMAEEISGNADMGNNYSGMPANLRAVLPDPPAVPYGGETVETLKAKLRVKNGKVNISGSAVAGYADVKGNTVKETLDCTYVSDGFGGTAGASSVNSDNGTTNAYDLADGKVTFPKLTFDTYTKNGITYANYLAYMQANALVYNPGVDNKGVPIPLTIKKGTAFSISDAGGNNSLTVDASGNMTIKGIVYCPNDIQFGNSGQINYSGHGTLVTPGSIYVHCNVLPKTKFPTTDSLGLCAAKNVELATGNGDSQLTMALACYAQQSIVSAKQNEIAGTYVCSYFSMSNVPKLYQAPDLVNYLPPGLPGQDPIYITSISTLSWMEVTPP